MNVGILTPTNVTPTLFVQTLKDPTFVVAWEDMTETAKTAQVLQNNFLELICVQGNMNDCGNYL